MGSKNRHPMNKTVIKNGRIVRLRKDGSIQSDLGPYLTKHKKNLDKKN